jgi:hypothetical protein
MSSVFLPIDDLLTQFLEDDLPFYAAHCAVLRPSYSVRPAELLTKQRDLTTPVISTSYSGFNMESREGGHMSGAAMQHTIAFSEAEALSRVMRSFAHATSVSGAADGAHSIAIAASSRPTRITRCASAAIERCATACAPVLLRESRLSSSRIVQRSAGDHN